MTDPMPKSILSNRHKDDCFACRLTSGLGLSGMGIYVWYHGKAKTNKISRYSMYTIASAAFGVGLARLFNLYPFNVKNKRNS